MLPATILDPVIVDTVLGRLALLFLRPTDNDILAARTSAGRMVAAYKPATEEEFSLAADVVGFRFHALNALSQASASDLSLNKQMRLRGNAASLNREAHRSQRKLDQVQRDRCASAARERAEAAATMDGAANGKAPDTTVPSSEPAVAGKPLASTWTKFYQDRQRAKRLAKRGGIKPAIPAGAAAAANLPEPAAPQSAAPTAQAGSSAVGSGI
jgi:hypothetical protein